MIEAVGVKIKLTNNDWSFLISIYRSPNSASECIRELEHVLSYDKEGNTEASQRLIVGDFNFREIDWESETSNVNENHTSSHFLEAVRDNFLYQHVKEANTNERKPKFHFWTLSFQTRKIIYNTSLGKSDHLILQFDIVKYVDRFTSQIEKLFFFKGNYREIRKKNKRYQLERHYTG